MGSIKIKEEAPLKMRVKGVRGSHSKGPRRASQRSASPIARDLGQNRKHLTPDPKSQASKNLLSHAKIRVDESGGEAWGCFKRL